MTDYDIVDVIITRIEHSTMDGKLKQRLVDTVSTQWAYLKELGLPKQTAQQIIHNSIKFFLD